MGGGKDEFAGEIAALCFCGPEDLWEVWGSADSEHERAGRRQWCAFRLRWQLSTPGLNGRMSGVSISI